MSAEIARHRRPRHLVRIAALAVTVTLLLAACGNSGDDDSSSGSNTSAGSATTASKADLQKNVTVSQPGVTDKQIGVAVIASKTNPLNGKYAELADGINAYFDMVNSSGGIYGRQLKIIKQRDDVIGLQNKAQVQASLAQDNAFATFIASLMLGGAPDLDAAHMPTFIWNINPEMAGHDNIFANSGALCFGCTGQTLPYMAKQVGATKVGVLAYGVSNESKLCAQGDRKSFEKYPTAKVAFYDDTIGFAEPNLSAQVSKMKQAGVDFITTCMDINEVIVLAKEMRQQGMSAIQHLPNGYDKALVGKNADLLNGDIVIPQFVALEHQPQIQEQKTYLEWMDKIGKAPIEVATMGWILAAQFVEGLKLAGPNFTQQKVIDGLNTLTAYSDNGFIQPINWTKQHEDPATHPSARGPNECSNFTKIENGEFVSVWGQKAKPWVCFKTDAPQLDAPTYMSFAPTGSGN
jgi:ABC-type branched-subunit amino acid transport system substrate-binding protein